MSLNKALEELKFDKRLIEINLKLGRINQEEVDKTIQQLPDLSNDVEHLNLDDQQEETSTI